MPQRLAIEALQRNVIFQFQQIVSASPTLSDELQTIAANIQEPGRAADFIASSLPFLTTADKQALLESADVAVRLEKINQFWPRRLKCSSCATRSRPKCRTRCSSRSAITTCANS
jgi:ATP-dependent Lon protease